MKISKSNRQDAKVKRELTKQLCLKWKLEHFSNEEISTKLFEQGIGRETDGELNQYTPAYVGMIVREALREVAAERSDHGKLVQVELEQELRDLMDFWRPRATDEDAPSLKAAEFVRKAANDLAVLTGANAPVETIVSVRVESALEGFVETIKNFMPESSFDDLIRAIEAADKANREYWIEQKQLKSGDSDILDVEVIE